MQPYLDGCQDKQVDDLTTSAPDAAAAPDAVACCPPITSSALDAAQAESAAATFKALADPVRLRIFSSIASSPGAEVCVCDIPDVGVSGPTVSHHLKKLREAGLLTSRRQGTWVYYAAQPTALTAVAALLEPPG